MENGFGDSYRKMEMERTHFEILKDMFCGETQEREGG